MSNKKAFKVPTAAILALLSLGLMMMPVPAWVLDALFTFNIAVGLVVLLAALKTEKPLEFSIFPTALLLATLLRLALNVASTRLILSEGHTGSAAAGHVVEAFGKFLLGGNFIVGFLIFAILLIINFMVITKGAGRIAEVSARFALDSMPGKQMAIDADLSAGLIGEKEARERREEVAREADFYGSMDGASKFVRGDALAAMLIFFLGSIGGILVGLVSNGMGAGAAADAYLPLAVGDAIASQVPALLLSVAAGVIVSKSGTRGNLSDTLAKQFGQPGPMKQGGLALGLLGVLPGMPHLPFLLCAGGLWLLGSMAQKKEDREEAQEQEEIARPPEEAAAGSTELSWEEIGSAETIAMEIGYRLIPLADPSQGGDFLAKARALRRKFAEGFGFLPPPLRVRDNLDLPPTTARVLIRGAVVAEATIYADRLMCLKDGSLGGLSWPLPGIEGTDPAFGLPALWIERSMESMARSAGLAVIHPAAALATLFSKTLTENAKSLFGLTELKGLLEWHFKEPKALAEWVPGQISTTLLLKVCKELLEEAVPLRDFETVLAEAALAAKRSDEAAVIAEQTRRGLGASIAIEAFGQGQMGRAWVLDERLENLIAQALGQPNGAMEPELARRLVEQVSQRIREEEAAGGKLVILVADRVRSGISKLLRRSAGDLRVLAYGEIPDGVKVEIAGTLG